MPSYEEQYNILSNQLLQGNLVAFLGAGVSLEYRDGGKVLPGISSAREIVDDLVSKKIYIKSSMNFEQAFFAIKRREGRNEVERLIQTYVRKRTIKPLPAHNFLASLNFSAYLTTNFDTLLEESLESNDKRSSQIIDDEDVSRWHGASIPVIKLHGCISRPATMIAAEDEYILLQTRAQVVAALVKVILANKVMLFCGYSLKDTDFKFLYQDIKNILGNHMPQSYAVVHASDTYDKDFWKAQGITIIESDLTDFLKGLYRAVTHDLQPDMFKDASWINNVFFESLLEIKTSPSETQAIDAFLRHFHIQIQLPGISNAEVCLQAAEAIRNTLESKKNFHALKNMWDSLNAKMAALDSDDKAGAEAVLDGIIEQRLSDSTELSKKWREKITKRSRLLVFSQSIRLLDLLKAVRPAIQNTCKIYICECRPKSPKPFQDAIAICESLKDTDYHQIVVPDVSVGNLLARKKVDMIIMGAHSVYCRDSKPISFVNTCGTNLIVLTAAHYGIPVYIIAEKSKIVDLSEGQVEEVSYEEEENIFKELTFEGLNDPDKFQKLNIGYDLCQTMENVTLLTED